MPKWLLFPSKALVLLFVLILPIRAKEPQHENPASPAPTPQSDYPDSTSGLEHLAKDIMKAQKDNYVTKAESLLQSLILPNPKDWYAATFGPTIAGNEGTRYAAASGSIPPTMAREFLNAAALGPNEITAHRFDKTCDDNAGEFTFGVLQARIAPTPLYELRFIKGAQMRRLYAFAYVNGGFRFILAPKLEGNVFAPLWSAQKKPKDDSGGGGDSDADTKRILIGGNVQSAKIIKKVQPDYPEVARREHLEGKVRIHALIATDGSVQHLYVFQGYCSLAESAYAAVRQWKYTPTLINGNPVEVDTEIDVFYNLAR